MQFITTVAFQHLLGLKANHVVPLFKVLCPSRWPCGEVDFNICYNNSEHSAFRWFMESLGYSGRESLRKQAFLIKSAQTVALSCIDLYF